MREPAEWEGSAQPPGRAALPGEGAAQLRWLSPTAASLVILSRPPGADTWPQLRADPGAVLLLLRHASEPAGRPIPGELFPNRLLDDPATLEQALDHLTSFPSAPGPSEFVDWSRPEVEPVYRASVTLAGCARRLALRGGRCDPERAWVAGLLAPLGWLAVSALAPKAVSACLQDPAWKHDPAAVQLRHWGLEQSAIARRLARRWRLPGWLTGVVGHLGLPLEQAREVGGADPVLLAVTRLAVCQAGQAGITLGLLGADQPGEDEDSRLRALRAAGLTEADWCVPVEAGERGISAWEDPASQPLLLDLIAAAADNRRLRDAALHRRLEREVDDLHRALEVQARGEADRLRAAKLAALAEFAAGAGHEINNPLAVISGQAQYLLGHQQDWFPADSEGSARKALQAVLAQTRRIHGILRDLMQFARPAPPRPAWVDLPTLLGEVAAGLLDRAAQRRVRLEVVARPERLAVHVDAEQVRTALTCLVRNALEAAPAEGWARIALVEPGVDRVEVAVEDSGPGPAAGQRAALFDPFYSGRNAGRGRGLGLPVAWRLARQQGGDVYLDPPQPGQPTRFVLTLPRALPSAEATASADGRDAA